MNELLRVENISKSFFNRETHADFSVLNSVSFTLNDGEILGIMGPSGCGKSTLLRVIKGFYTPDAGKIIFDNVDITGHKPQSTPEIQMIFQDPYNSFNPVLRLRASFAELIKIKKITWADIKNNIRNISLPESVLGKFPRQLSGGQLQRLSILRALLMNPRIILADEPTSSLDLSIQAKVLNLFARIQKEKHISIIFVSHDPDVIKYISDKTIKLG